MISAELYFTSSDSDEEQNQNRIAELKNKRRYIRDYSNPLDLEEYSFIQNFRLSKIAFTDLFEQLGQKLKQQIRNTSIPNIIKLANVLRFCAHGSYQGSVGNDFHVGLAQPTFSVVLKEVLNVFAVDLCPKWIKFHYTPEEKSRAKRNFYDKSGIPGIIGAVDGTHIKIRSPNQNVQHLYYNRKGFFSINAVLICDHNQVIRFVSARYPGATHDSLIWNMSNLKDLLEKNYLDGERNTWLLGDAGYPLAPYLITLAPYLIRNVEQNSQEARFNKNHSQARIIIERTIGVLKNRFMCLIGARELHYSPDKATRIINICVALHNICMKYKVNFDEELRSFEEDDSSINENESSRNDNPHYQNGSIARQRILRSMFP